MRRRKRGGCLVPFLVLLGVFAGIILACGIFLFAMLGKIGRVADPSGVDWSSADMNVMKNSNVKNILLIGQDARPGEDRARSDSMILVSLNKATKKVTMISIMRDLYVSIPGYEDNRINASYQYGGTSLLDQTIANSLGVLVDANVEVNFESFMKVIDEVGGVDIELNQEEADYLNVNNTGMVNGVTGDPWSLVAGVNTLNAEQALAYARTRYVGNSDWERTDRQRKVMTAIYSKFSHMNPVSQLSMINTLLPSLTTDMSNSEILGYLYTAIRYGMGLNENSYRIPVDGTYSNQTLGEGMEVLVPDLDANRQYIQQYIEQG